MWFEAYSDSFALSLLLRSLVFKRCLERDRQHSKDSCFFVSMLDWVKGGFKIRMRHRLGLAKILDRLWMLSQMKTVVFVHLSKHAIIQKYKVNLPGIDPSCKFILNMWKDLRKWCCENILLFVQRNEIQDELLISCGVNSNRLHTAHMIILKRKVKNVSTILLSTYISTLLRE